MISMLDNFFYPGRHRSWDDEMFRDVILNYVNRQTVLLDLGAGSGRIKHMNFRGVVKIAAGIDLDDRVLANPQLDESKVCAGECIDYPDDYFDLVISDNVVEHLDDPVSVFKEVHRVLKKSGLLLFKTPNAWHYVALVSRITPLSFHKYYNSLRGRIHSETFPVYYKANSLGRIRKIANEVGFDLCKTIFIEDRPEYLRVNAALYCMGILFERAVNSTELLKRYRAVIIGVMQKA